jgi:hypothetical protein
MAKHGIKYDIKTFTSGVVVDNVHLTILVVVYTWNTLGMATTFILELSNMNDRWYAISFFGISLIFGNSTVGILFLYLLSYWWSNFHNLWVFQVWHFTLAIGLFLCATCSWVLKSPHEAILGMKDKGQDH